MTRIHCCLCRRYQIFSWNETVHTLIISSKNTSIHQLWCRYYHFYFFYEFWRSLSSTQHSLPSPWPSTNIVFTRWFQFIRLDCKPQIPKSQLSYHQKHPVWKIFLELPLHQLHHRRQSEDNQPFLWCWWSHCCLYQWR